MKRVLSYFIVGIICIGIGVGASNLIKADDVVYTGSKTSVNTVQDAIDELYSYLDNYKSSVSSLLKHDVSKHADTSIVLNDDLTWKTSSVSYNDGYYYWKLDLTNIDLIEVVGNRIEYSGEQYNKQRIAIVDTLPGQAMNYSSYIEESIPEGNFDLKLDVSNLTGEYYFIIDVTASDGNVDNIYIS